VQNILGLTGIGYLTPFRSNLDRRIWIGQRGTAGGCGAATLDAGGEVLPQWAVAARLEIA
jgi:hypothetical protein